MAKVSTVKSRIAKALEDMGHPLLKSEWEDECKLELWSQAHKVRRAPVLCLKVTESQLPMTKMPTVAHRLAAVANVCNSFNPPLRMRVIGHHEESWGPEKRGERDVMDRLHNWSPINLDRNGKIKGVGKHRETNILYVSFQYISHKFLNEHGTLLSFKELSSPKKMALVRSYCGDTVESVARRAHDRGYTPPILPAPRVLSLGGVLAIGGHGSRMSDSKAEEDDKGKAREWPGSISASVERATVVMWDEGQGKYVAKNLNRNSPYLPFAAASLGRVIVVDVVLRCLPDYCLSLEYKKMKIKDVFGTNENHPDSIASLAKQGGYEVLAFRPAKGEAFAERSAHVVQWNHSPAKPRAIGWRGFHGLAPLFDLRAVGANGAEHISWKTVAKNAGKVADKVADGIAAGKKKDEGKKIDRYVRTAGEQRMYAHSDVTPVEASGWAIVIPKHDLQKCARAVYLHAHDSLDATKKKTKFEWRSHRHLVFECRSANLDDIGNSAADRIPNLSMAAPYRDPATGTVHDGSTHMVLWVSVLYLTTRNTLRTVGLYLEHFEGELHTLCDSMGWILRPEWAKGWGYASTGAWKWNKQQIEAWLEKAWPGGARDEGSWRHACKLAHDMDPHGVMSSPFHDKLLP